MKKTAVITGASSGIGIKTAQALKDAGFDVYSISRTAPPDDSSVFIKGDITNKNAVIDCFEQILALSGSVDLLVSNAGFGISGNFEFTDTDDQKRMFETNVFGAGLVIQQALPYLRKSRGMIISVSSLAAILPVPYQSGYSACKAAINAFTMALRNELKPFGVRVCAVMPGDIKTSFTKNREKSQKGDDIYQGRTQRAVSRMEQDEQNGMPPERIAEKIVAISKKKRVKPFYTVGIKYKLFAVLTKILPASLVCTIEGWIYK